MSVPDPAVEEPRSDREARLRLPTHGRRQRYLEFRTRTATATARLAEVYGTLPEKPQLNNAQRWLFDNDYLLWRSLARVAEDMPRRFFDRLPPLPDGTTRVEAVIGAYLASHDDRVTVADLLRYLHDYQAGRPLDLAELWAVPTIMRLALMEKLLADVDSESAVAAAVLGLHEVQRQDWTRFVEAASVVESRLAKDPAGVYALMDDGTRDRYRSAVEKLAERAGASESEVCDAVIAAAATANSSSDPSSSHVGTYLVGHLQRELEDRLGFTPDIGTRLRRASVRFAPVLYVASLVVVAAVVATPLVANAVPHGGGWGFALLALALAVPVWLAAEAVVQRLAAMVVPPRVLPKLDLLRSAGDEHKTLVAMPCLLTDRATIDALFERLERHYVASAVGPLADKLSFALLADLPDAPQETVPADTALLDHATELLDDLKERNPTGDIHLLVRRRLLNEAEGVWMGWERKRGKLMELNELLLEGKSGTFVAPVSPATFNDIRFVITLDADSGLPPGAAAALIGALSHPVNRARFNAAGRVVGGYTVLQPRIEVAPGSAGRTRFSRMYAGSRGLDLYSLAVSDTYMDLFGEGLYAGKGIYEVASFDKSLRGAVPENAILSHDLFEGGRGRAGLLTDVVLFEGIPTKFLAYLHRQQRWTRGDWQLLPFLRGGGLSWVAGWAASQNLVRSLAPLSYLAALLAAYVAPPGAVATWVVVTLLLLGTPYLIGMVNHISATRGADGRDRWGIGGVVIELQRWAFELVVLPVTAAAAVAAIVVTLKRVYVSRQHLLQWRGAAGEAVDAENLDNVSGWWREMAVAPVTAAAATVLLSAFRPQALYWSLPLLSGWALAPLIAMALSRPIRRVSKRLTEPQQRKLRSLARRTWLYFERFVGPEDRWLPPDHFQEAPRGAVAHRTSPTNIGLLLTSTHGAYDLGFLGMRSLVGRLTATFATMASLQTHKGHFLNWYDTNTLQPLAPRYVSTVDSGNLLACLVAVRGGCLELETDSVNRWESFEGLLTLLDLYDESVTRLPTSVAALRKHIALIGKHVREAAPAPQRWPALLDELETEWLPKLDELLLDAVRRAGTASDHERLTELAVWSGRLHRHVQEAIRDSTLFMPWLDHGHGGVPSTFADLPVTPTYAELPGLYALIERKLTASAATGAHTADAALLNAVAEARTVLAGVMSELVGIVDAVDDYLENTDLGFLYDRDRHIFRIGFDVENARLDEHAYDLFASEARLASFIAVAYGKVPVTHWLHLSRPYSRAGAARALLSWSGTMFEYLTPSLLLPTPAGSVTANAIAAAIDRQIAFGEANGVPWGVSESGYAATDAQQNYQYYAFGVPDLALARVATTELVIAPYASLMALRFEPQRVLANLARLDTLGALGQYGYYEALDFTATRRTTSGGPTVVRSFMAHHHGMAFMAIGNLLLDDRFVKRFRHDVRVRSVEYLLHEGTPAMIKPERLDDRQRHSDLSTVERHQSVAWVVKPVTAVPLVNTVSNGRMTVMTTNSGAGFTRWNGLDLTRWRSDPTTDEWGEWLHIRAMHKATGPTAGTARGTNGNDRHDRAWSATRLPSGVSGSDERVTFYPHSTEYGRTVDGVVSRLAVTVAPEDDVAIRMLTLTNGGDATRELAVTSYGEVVLAEHGADVRHPAFGNLFVESSFDPTTGALLFRRRPRSATEKPQYLLHALVSPDQLAGPLEYDSDRRTFIGRGGTVSAPAGLSAATLAGTVGATLDPVFALRARLSLRPNRTKRLAAIMVAGTSRRAVLATAERYLHWHRLEGAFEEAEAAQARALTQPGTEPEDLPAMQRLLSQLLYPSRVARSAPEVLRANRGGQRGLWAHGISGDHPILLVKVAGSGDVETVRVALAGHRRWREQGITVDLVVVNEGDSGYRQTTYDALRSLMNGSGNELWLDRPGGIFLLSALRLQPDDVTLLEAVARVVIGPEGRLPPIPDDVGSYSSLPAFTATNPELLEQYQGEGIQRPTGLEFDNGYGGFASDGREYVIYRPSGKPDPATAAPSTPAPWINVIANPSFGTLVSEVGSSTTWAVNSSENRLTPWSNDAVCDPSGEVLYLRDEETGAVWTPTPEPRPAAAPYVTRHTAGSTAFEHTSNGLDQRMTVFVPPDAPVKVVKLNLRNRSGGQRRLTATYYAQWLLGTTPEATGPHLVAEYDSANQALLARNSFNQEFGAQVVFLTGSLPIHGLTTDRGEFLGREGGIHDPMALQRIGLSGNLDPGSDPCAVVQLHVELAAHAETELFFVMGRGQDRAQASELLQTWRQPERIATAWRETNEFWDQLLGTVQVATPDRAMDIVLNRWLLYQTVTCRLWGRSGFYQSSGAYGFRDQLQDAMAMVHARPELLREQLLEAARHQFEEGDVLHWWHPPGGQGVRTRFSDDLAWLPFAAAHYLDTTGDHTVLDEELPYLTGPSLPEGVDEKYDRFQPGGEAGTLYDHCLRAIDRACTSGQRGLPLMGSGDWNDGMNRVGAGGKGESVWLAWFLITTLQGFALVCDDRGERERAEEYRQRAESYRQAVETHAWDGEWYVRAFYDDGAPLGSRLSDEPKIDALSQAWSVLSGAGDPARARQALRAARERLIDEANSLILLLKPPFDRGAHDPGYIKGYPPGVRENGGQYTHAAVWTVWALASLGSGPRAELAGGVGTTEASDSVGELGGDATELFAMINPINLTDHQSKAERYRVEPYVVAADVYGAPPHTGKGGWTWYTGSASWLYRLGLERLLGVTRHGDTLCIDPRVPLDWPGYVVTYRYKSSVYRIEVKPHSAGDTVGDADRSIQLVDDGEHHDITVRPRGEAAAV